jgi:hypothetical protein
MPAPDSIGRAWSVFAAAALFAAAVVAITPLAHAEDVPSPAGALAFEAARARVVAGQDPIPGPRSCFFRYGPISGDPYINIAFPDAGTFYWGAAFSVPEGARLELEGAFPHARYMSLISYDGLGAPIDSLVDHAIEPLPGAVNPYRPGADRTARRRSYRVEIVDAQPAEPVKWGTYRAQDRRDRLHAPHYGEAGQRGIVYRIYAKDESTDETAGVGLPMPVLTLADGRTLRGDAACRALKASQPLVVDAAALAVPLARFRELVAAAQARGGPEFPATDPPTWSKSSEDMSRYSIYTGETAVQAGVRRKQGSFYANLDNQYVRTFVNRRLGPVFVLRAKAPTTPRTWRGDAVFSDGELRYWSWCSQQGFATGRVNACLFDEQIPVGPDGFYTLVLSRPEDRPRNALPECGIAWLPMAPVGDGAGDPDMTLLTQRHMLGRSEFPHAIQNVRSQESIEQDMGPYFPRGRYTTTSAFETARPCLLEAR